MSRTSLHPRTMSAMDDDGVSRARGGESTSPQQPALNRAIGAEPRPTTSELLHGKRSDSAAARAPRGRLELEHVSKNFSETVPALRDIQLVCEPGEFVVVVGPSGCGKSTLLNIAAGMLRPDEGRAVLDGKGVWAPSPQLAMVFQEHGLFPWLNAYQNIEFGLKM